jgi:methylated-DNA-protein-cysteine methyltransferase-like protein
VKGGEHQERILDAIRAIPEGFVATYGDVSPGAPRLAGRLLGSVHAPDIPWWRVVRADGSLAGGAEQRRRLEREGVAFRPGNAGRRRVDLRATRLGVSG